VRVLGASTSGFVTSAMQHVITPTCSQYLGRETESYDVFSAPSGTGCARSCVNVCKMKLYRKGTGCRIRQIGKRPYGVLRKITYFLFHIQLLTPFFTSVLCLSRFLPTSATCSVTCLSPSPTHTTDVITTHHSIYK
jgi:hypothetical protein